MATSLSDKSESVTDLHNPYRTLDSKQAPHIFTVQGSDLFTPTQDSSVKKSPRHFGIRQGRHHMNSDNRRYFTRRKIRRRIDSLQIDPETVQLLLKKR